jgi:NAD(P)-dependent dehydrogenase (short-subunit alcohol dehydrogenase family)
MSRVFITESSDGLRRAAPRRLLAAGHTVVGHARNAWREEELRERLTAARVPSPTIRTR